MDFLAVIALVIGFATWGLMDNPKVIKALFSLATVLAEVWLVSRMLWIDGPVGIHRVIIVVIGSCIVLYFWLSLLRYVDSRFAHSHKPDISARLVIDNPRPEVAFHFEIENLSAVPAHSVMVSYDGGGLQVVKENADAYKRVLERGKPLTILGVPATFKTDAFNKLEVFVRFQGRPSASEEMVRQFTFHIRREDLLRAQTFHPITWSEYSYDPDAAGVKLTRAINEGFARSKGAFSTVLFETVDGHPNHQIISNERRALVFDPEKRIVIFQMLTILNYLVNLQLPLKSTDNNAHSILVNWDDTDGATLYVDGEKKEDVLQLVSRSE